MNIREVLADIEFDPGLALKSAEHRRTQHLLVDLFFINCDSPAINESNSTHFFLNVYFNHIAQCRLMITAFLHTRVVACIRSI